MTEYIYLKFAELTLKGKNRQDFVNRLAKNIHRALAGFQFQLVRRYDCFWLAGIPTTPEREAIVAKLAQLPGLSWIHLVTSFLWTERDAILPFALNALNGYTSFRLDVRRHDKSYPWTSRQITDWLAGFILESNKTIRVDLHHPEIDLKLEVKRDEIFVYEKSMPGVGGLPVGSSGRCLVLLSGGIDSPVASRLLMQRGLNVDFLTFITPPHTKPEALEKVFTLSQIVSDQHRLTTGRLFVCNFSDLQHEISHIERESYRITLMRRTFLRIAKRFALEHNYDALATGESLGQVASQTVASMQVISEALDGFLLLRPLVAFDKESIVRLATKIGTYAWSILPYDDSCALFAPKNPVTHPELAEAKRLEEGLELLEPLTNSAYAKIFHKEVADDNYSPNCPKDCSKPEN